MNEDKILDFFDNLLENPEKFANNMDEALKESSAFFNELMQFIQNGSEKDQKMIGKTMEVVSKRLNDKFESLCQENGVEKESLDTLLKDPKNFSSEAWDALEKMREEMTLPSPDEVRKMTSESTKKKKKKTKNWLSA